MTPNRFPETGIDRTRATEAFATYASAYDPSNPRIALKISHTMRVAALCERIARGLELPREDVDLAWLSGLVHDIGRFEQVRRYDTFNDSATVSHATLGAQVLFDASSREAPLIRQFVAGSAHDAVIRTAVETHSALRLPASLDERTQTLCNVLRDADKIDILEVNCTCPIEDIYAVPESAMVNSELSPECVELFYRHQCLPRNIRRFPADIMLGHICFAWELVFSESVEIVREQGHLRQMLHRTWANPSTQAAFAAIAEHLANELNV